MPQEPFDLEIDIDVDCIKQGLAGNCYKCPAALATLKTARFRYGGAGVQLDEVIACTASLEYWRAPMTEELRAWIAAFDCRTGTKPAPAKFTLRFERVGGVADTSYFLSTEQS